MREKNGYTSNNNRRTRANFKKLEMKRIETEPLLIPYIFMKISQAINSIT